LLDPLSNIQGIGSLWFLVKGVRRFNANFGNAGRLDLRFPQGEQVPRWAFDSKDDPAICRAAKILSTIHSKPTSA